MSSRRRLARVSAMQTIFERQIREADVPSSLSSNIAELGGEETVDTPFAKKLTEGVLEGMTAIRIALEKHAPEWPLDRMDALTRSILLIGAYELLISKDAPPPVVMNEAIEIAKEYGPEESPKFVNGVLNAIAHHTK